MSLRRPPKHRSWSRVILCADVTGERSSSRVKLHVNVIRTSERWSSVGRTLRWKSRQLSYGKPTMRMVLACLSIQSSTVPAAYPGRHPLKSTTCNVAESSKRSKRRTRAGARGSYEGILASQNSTPCSLGRAKDPISRNGDRDAKVLQVTKVESVEACLRRKQTRALVLSSPSFDCTFLSML